MNVLAIETSTLTGSVALLSEGKVRGEITLSVSVQHSERLMPTIERLLQDTDSPIDLFAVATGPGSFTGLRIGIAAALGLALAAGKPVVGISTLEGLAWNGIFFPGLIVPVLNAYRGEVYRGLYRRGAGWSLEAIEEDKAVSPTDLIRELKDHNARTLLLGNGVAICGEKVVEAVGDDRVRIAPAPFANPRASNIAFIAVEKFSAGLSSEPVLPRYLRKAG